MPPSGGGVQPYTTVGVLPPVSSLRLARTAKAVLAEVVRNGRFFRRAGECNGPRQRSEEFRLRPSGLPCRAHPASPTGAGPAHWSLWFVLLADQGPLDVHALRSTAGATKLTRPPPPHPTGPGAQRCPQRRPTLQTRVNGGMPGPAYSLASTRSTHLSVPAAELGDKTCRRQAVISSVQNPVQIKRSCTIW